MARTRCFYCDETTRESPDPTVPWVHSHSGNSYCDVRTPEDAVTRAGWPGRTEATLMLPGMFRARCQRGHELVVFDDREAFEAHMTGEHKARKPMVGHIPGKGRAPGFTEAGSIAPPRPWRAPKAPATTERLTAVLLGAMNWERYRYSTDPIAPDWVTEDIVDHHELAPGDVFVMRSAPGIPYTVLEVDPERGWRVQRTHDNGTTRDAWLSSLQLPNGDSATVRTGVAA
jgi:hypothetical protein